MLGDVNECEASLLLECVALKIRIKTLETILGISNYDSDIPTPNVVTLKQILGNIPAFWLGTENQLALATLTNGTVIFELED